MQAINNYGEISSNQNKPIKKINDLVAISNHNLDDTISTINNTENSITISGTDYSSVSSQYIVIGHEIAKIESISYDGTDSKLGISREYFGTIKDSVDLSSHHIRTVDIYNNIKSWEYNNYNDSRTELFPFQLESGSVEIFTEENVNIKRRSTAIYLFKGFNNQNMLKYTGFISRRNIKYKNATRPQTVRLDFKDKFVKYFNKKITKSGILRGLQPKEFLSEVLNLDLDMVKYINGNIASDFNKINQMAYKEYEYYKDLLKEFTKTGVRVKFNEIEELCITSDITIDNLNVTNIDINDVDILEKNISEEDDYIVNKITGNFYERNKFVQDFEGDYVWFEYSTIINKTILSNPSLYEFNTITVTNTDLFERTQIGDLVLLEDTEIGNENCFYGKTISYDEDTSTVTIQLGFDKDNQLYQKGRLASLFSTYNTSREFNLHFVRRQLPYIWQKQLNIGGEKRSSNLKIPILPQVNGRDENNIYQEIEFGFPENIEIGEYAGYVDDIEKIYKIHNPEDLYYNKEIKQFSSTSDSPVYALSTRIDDSTYSKKGDSEYLTFNTFDNSNLEINIEESESKDANITFKNISAIDESDIKLIEQTNIEQISSRIFKITSSYYNILNIGDIVTLKEPSEITGEYLENRDLNWIIESLYDDIGEYYMVLNGSIEDTFDFEVYPAQSVVYLNEFSLLGNPMIEYISPFEYSNSNSILEFEEREVEIDGRLLDYEGFQKIADYYYSNFGGTEDDITKRIIPLKLRNKMELQKYDIIEIESVKYIVLGEATKDALTGNQSTYYVMNINTQNSTPANIPLKKYLKYDPVDIPIYNHNGNEGTLNEDKTGIDGENIVSKLDEQYGLVTLNPLPTTALSGNISDVESDKLFTINATVGTGYENWLTNGEYRVIRLDSEFILGRITSSNKFKVVKRGLIQSPQTEIKLNKEIKFYSIMNINIDGKSRFSEFKAGNNDKFIEFSEDTGIDINSDKGYIGSDNNYFDITNSRISIGATTSNGYFSVGSISNDNYLIYDNGNFDIKSTGTIDISNTNNELYFAPTGQVSSIKLATNGSEGYFSVGDTTNTDYIEYDNTTSKVNIKGNVDIVSGSGFNQIFRQDTEPTVGNYNDGDIWIDTNDNNKMYQYDEISGNFISNLVQDSATALEVANGKNTTYYQESEPLSNIIEGDIWIDTNDLYKLYTYNGISWQLSQDSKTAQQTADGKSTIYYQTSEPGGVGYKVGDTWIDTDNNLKLYNWDGSSWLLSQDSATAQSTANQALLELDNIGNDGILTPTEKVIANEKRKEIEDEYANLTSKAISIGYISKELDTKWNSYKTVYENLDSYLNIVLSPLDTEESINRTEWNNKWQAYYNEAKIIDVVLGNYIVDYTNVQIGDNAVTKPDATTGNGFYVNTSGYARIHNVNNDFYFDAGTDESYFRLNSNKVKLGKDAVGVAQDGFYITDNVTTPTKYLSFNVTDGSFSLASDDINMSGGSISLSAADSFDIATNNFSLTTTGALDISNNSNANRLYMSATSSYLNLATDGNSGSLQIGDNNSNNYFQYDNTGKIEIKSYKLKIVDGLLGIGENALSSNDSTSSDLIAIGKNAMLNATGGTDNISIGRETMSTNTNPGLFNIGIGQESLKNLASSGESNICMGIQSGLNITDGKYNMGIGALSLRSNTVGYGNIGIGVRALRDTSTAEFEGNNIAIGYFSMANNTTGIENIAIGSDSLRNNINGGDNVAIGEGALLNSTTNRNTAVGHGALSSQTSGSQNTALGRNSLGLLTSGSRNTALGQCGISLETGSNNTIIGYGANPSNTGVSNEITLGNSSITALRCNATSITSLSDKRDKADIADISLGLGFVKDLNPSEFMWDRREWYEDGMPNGSKKKDKTCGFIAQDLQNAIKKHNAEHLKLVYEVNEDKLEITQGNLIPVLTKAIQEQQKIIESQDDKIQSLEERLSKLENA